MRSTRLSLAVVGLLVLIGAAQALAVKPADEPFFPRAGNEGYDALHYDVRLAYNRRAAGSRRRRWSKRWRPKRCGASPSTSPGPRSTKSRSAADRPVSAAGTASWSSSPPGGIAAGQRFTALVRYGGLPPRVTDPDGSAGGLVPHRRRRHRGRRAAGDRRLDPLRQRLRPTRRPSSSSITVPDRPEGGRQRRGCAASTASHGRAQIRTGSNGRR